MKSLRVIGLSSLMLMTTATPQTQSMTGYHWKTLQTPIGPNKLGLLELKQIQEWKKTLSFDYSIGNDNLILSIIFLNIVIGLIYRALLCRNVVENGLMSRPINLLTGTLRALAILLLVVLIGVHIILEAGLSTIKSTIAENGMGMTSKP